LFAELLFWLVSFLLFYTYVGYSIIVFFAGKICNKTIAKKSIQPLVTLIIAAHNEQDCIKEKIKNALKSNYPKDKLEIIVASDCSTDDTNIIVKGFEDKGVILCEQTERLGKTAAQIAAVRKSKGEILVFSDASTIYDKDAIGNLIKNFYDTSVGCVGGKVMFLSADKRLEEKKSTVIDIEHKIREGENRIYSTCVVSGCIYAVRKSYFREIDYRIADDIGVPIDMLMRGYRVVFEPDAIGHEDMEAHTINIARNTRTINQGWVALELLHFLSLFSSFPGRFIYMSFILLGHKVLRWLTFVFLALLFFLNIFIVFNTGSAFFIFLLFFQALFYFMSLIGGWLCLNNKLLKFAYSFCRYHYAAMIAFFKFYKKERIVIWNTKR